MDIKERLKRTDFKLEDVLHMFAPEPMTAQEMEEWDGDSSEEELALFNATVRANWFFVSSLLKAQLDETRVYTSKELYEVLYKLSEVNDEFITASLDPGHAICPITFRDMADDFYDLDRPDKSFAWNTETNQKVHTGYLPR